MRRHVEQTVKALLATLALMLITFATQVYVTGGFDPQDDNVTVWFFDVGQGDAIFIDAPDAQVLIDGGPGIQVVEKLSAVMPFWDKDLDLLINTHPHADHVTGLVHVLQRYGVNEVWTSGQDYGTDIFDAFTLMADEEPIQKYQVYDLGAGASLTVLWPLLPVEGLLENTHDANVAVLLEYGRTTMLFTGDMETEVEEHILHQLEHIDVLKVGHHGSLTSTSPELLDVITPDYAVIQVGEGNDYGHPNPVILDRLESRGITVLRNDLDGDIRVITEGGEPSLTIFDL